jgi:NTE family protein
LFFFASKNIIGFMMTRFSRETSKIWRRGAGLPIQAGILIFLLVFSPTHARSSNRSRQEASRAPKIGLALGGGGARGMAHIGVIMALEEEGIPIDMIAGTSAGSIMGGLYAAGYSGREMREIMKTVNWKNVFREAPFPRSLWVSQRYGLRQPIIKVYFAFWKIFLPRGLINGQHISEELFRLTTAANYAARSDFDKLAIPFRSVAVDISTGKLYALEKGSLAQAIRASTAIPGYYYPTIFDDKLMVDGGILDIVPVDVTKEMGADMVIAVKVNQSLVKGKEPQNLVGILENMLDIMVAEIGARQLPRADILIEPDLGTHSSLDYSGLDSIIEKGYKAAKEKMPEIKKLAGGRVGQEIHSNRKLDAKALERAKVTKIRVISHTIGPQKTDESGDQEEPAMPKFASQKLILRYFPISLGREFDTEKALKGVEDLYATGLFQNVWLELDNPGDGNVEVNIHCLEGSSHFLGLGCNFRNEEGLSGFIQIVPFNLLRLGDRIMPLFRYGRLKITAGLEISIGRFLLSPFSLDTGLYYEKEKPYQYNDAGDNLGQLDIEKAMGKLSFGYQPSKNLYFALGFRGGHIWLGNNSLLGLNNGTLGYLTLFGKVIADNIDDMYFPTRGIQLILETETVLSTSSQGQYFTKLAGSFSWTRSLFLKQVITPFVKCGLSGNSLPEYEKFRVGGPTDMPGYHRQEVWGNNTIIFGLKHRIPLYKGLNFQTTLSMASMFDRLGDLDAEKFIAGISTGLAFSSPLGPVCLQYGWSGTGRNQYYLSLGYDF